MRHHAQHVAALAEHAGNVGQRAVGIGLGRHFACGCRVTEGNAVLALELRERGRVTEVVALHVADGNFEHFACAQRVGKGRVGGFCAQVNLFADVFQPGIAHQRSGQQAGLAKDLKAIADAEYQAAGGCEFLDRLHDGRKTGNGTGAQVVAVGKAAGHKNRITIFQVGGFMPEQRDGLVHHVRNGVVGVVVAVGAGKNKHAEFHLI